ncbi:MAG: type II toxin-antitoxin system RelE/ParE family toxin [Bacteroidetes bacterium]|nr:type II toxin-antitoxin system RelE/ParE family toxin [Bacteroidota bacterium]
MEEPVRKLFFFKNYFREFFGELPPKVREKFGYVLHLLEYVERVPEKFLKHIEGSKGLYEIRVEVGSDIYRAFCFFDKGRLVILVNGFQKKSQKTPKNEIELAERLMKEYFDNK